MTNIFFIICTSLNNISELIVQLFTVMGIWEEMCLKFYFWFWIWNMFSHIH